MANELRQAIEVACKQVSYSVPCTGKMYPEVALGRKEEMVLKCPKCDKEYILRVRPTIDWVLDSIEIKSRNNSGRYDPDLVLGGDT